MSQSQVEKNRVKVPRLQAELFEESGNSLGSYVTDETDRLIIGSSKRADLIVPHATVSQIHAMLRVVGEGDILLYDLGSERGTFVAGKRIIERRMNPGEIFEIGPHRVRVNLLDQLADELGGERAIFWKADCSVSPDRLEIVRLESGLVRDERTLLKNCRLFFGQRRNEILMEGNKRGEVFLHRRDSGDSHSTEAHLPAGYRAEIYNGENDLVRVVEETGSAFSFTEKEKVRLLTADEQGEVLIFWNEQGARVSRQAVDHESPALKKTLGICLALASVFLTVVSYVPLKKETVEEAVIPKTSYERLSMESAPAPAAAQQSDAESKDEAPAKQQVSKAASISSSLSKLLNKKSSLTADTIQQAISQNGAQTTRENSLKNANIKTEQINSGATGGGAVNVNAISAGLASGSGAKAGSLNGFANGKGTTIGGKGFGGKGFDLNLGGDEAEAIGGLDKSLIAAVVQANIGQIKHCYERQLIVDPNIFGKIVAQWTIGGDGSVTVSSVKKSTMNNKAVEGCILAKIKGWTFPKPKGGGQVIVSYPFLFKSLN
jgi:pSer/pThr/pTyr-binding forkhead associated (FHA) protein